MASAERIMPEDLESDKAEKVLPHIGGYTSLPGGLPSEEAFDTRGVSGRRIYDSLGSVSYILFHLILVILCITAAALGTPHRYYGRPLAFFILDIIVNVAVISEVGVKLVMLGPEFWALLWNLLDLTIAFFGAIGISTMFFSNAGEIMAIVSIYLLLSRSVLQVLHRASTLSRFGKISGKLSNPLAHSGLYTIFYLTMIILSIPTLALGLRGKRDMTAFWVLNIIMNIAMMSEVGARVIALGPRFRVSLWNQCDVLVVVIGAITLFVTFVSGFRRFCMVFGIIDGLFLLTRNALHFLRLAVIMRRSATQSPTLLSRVEDLHDATPLGYDNNNQAPDMDRIITGAFARLWTAILVDHPGGQHSSIRIEGEEEPLIREPVPGSESPLSVTQTAEAEHTSSGAT